MKNILDHTSLEQERKNVSLSREELAHESGVNHTTIFRIEKGAVPRLDSWSKIVAVIEKHKQSV